jgi:hypothetical protein
LLGLLGMNYSNSQFFTNEYPPKIMDSYFSITTIATTSYNIMAWKFVGKCS